MNRSCTTTAQLTRADKPAQWGRGRRKPRRGEGKDNCQGPSFFQEGTPSPGTILLAGMKSTAEPL